MSVHVRGSKSEPEPESDSEVELPAEADIEAGSQLSKFSKLDITADDLAKQQEMLELRYARSELVNLMKEARRKGWINKIKAEVCRVTNVIFLMVIGVCSAGMFTISAVHQREEDLPVTIVSGVVFAVTVLYGVVGPGSRGSYYNQVSIRLRGMYRTARESLIKINNSDEMIELVNMNMAEMDKMDLNIYSMGLGNAGAIPTNGDG